MVLLFRRTRRAFLCKHLRELHKNADAFNVPTVDINTEKKAFLDVLPEVINSVVTGPNLSQLPEVSRRVKQLLDYTLCGGKLLQGIEVSIGYRMFEDPTNFSEETQHSARILGWTTELLHAYLLLMDDMMDGAIMRSGKPCWHQQPDIGLNAINDGTLIYQSMMQVLEIYFAKTSYYADLLKLFNEGVCRVAIGKYLDFTSGHNKHKNNLDVFIMDHYNIIATHKTSYHSLRLPIFAALLLVKNGKEKATTELNNICMDFGKLMQCQDDYLDAYGDKVVTGKTGRDIQEGKCSWVAVTALQHCNYEKRAIFKEYYGSNDPEHVKRIKQLYDELHLPQLYEQYERTMYDDLMRRIHVLPNERDRIFIIEVLNANYKRVY